MPKLLKIPMLDEELASAAKPESKIPSEQTGFVTVVGEEANELLREFASYTDTSSAVRESSAMVREILNGIIPRSKSERIARAVDWAEKDDFLQDLIDIKCKFAVVGCTFHASTEELSDLESQLKISSGKAYSTEVEDGVIDDAEQKRMLAIEHANRFARQVHQRWDLTPIVFQLMKDWFVTDSMILYWKVDVTKPDATSETGEIESQKSQVLPGVLQIAALDPRDCRYDNSAGKNHLLYRLPLELKTKIQAILHHHDPSIKANAVKLLIEDGIPLEWIKAVENNRDEVLLKHELGDYWLVQTKARSYTGLADPSMKCIFPHLMKRQMLSEGEMSAAFMMKHLILHITMGESIDTGELCGSRKNWATPKETEAMHKVITRTAQSARLVTNHTVKFSFVFPPSDIWDPAKYITPEAGIARWAGVAKVISDGEGSTGSSGHISAKKLIADIIYARDRVRHIFIDFFSDQSIQESVELEEGIVISPKFDENVLKDARQILDELKLLFSSHAIDPESMVRETGRDPSLIRSRKARAAVDNQVTGVYRPLHEAPFGGFQQDKEDDQRSTKNGRPANSGTTTDDDTRNQPAITK